MATRTTETRSTMLIALALGAFVPIGCGEVSCPEGSAFVNDECVQTYECGSGEGEADGRCVPSAGDGDGEADGNGDGEAGGGGSGRPLADASVTDRDPVRPRIDSGAPDPIERDAGVVSMCSETCRDEDAGGPCDSPYSAVLGIKTVLDVWWQQDSAQPFMDPGRGQATVYLRSVVSGTHHDGEPDIGTTRICGLELPVIKGSATCDAYQYEVPNTVWDTEAMPIYVASGDITGFAPGDTIDINSQTMLAGISLSDVNGAWPPTAGPTAVTCDEGTGVSCFPDHEGDAKPGITLRMARLDEQLTENGCGGFSLPYVFRGIPTYDYLVACEDCARTDMLFAGLRMQLSAQGEMNETCSAATGESSAGAIELRVSGCRRDDGAQCDAEDAQTADALTPRFNVLAKGAAPPSSVHVPLGVTPLDNSPSVGPRTTLVRFDGSEDVTCADVRAAAYPRR